MHVIRRGQFNLNIAGLLQTEHQLDHIDTQSYFPGQHFRWEAMHAGRQVCPELDELLLRITLGKLQGPGIRSRRYYLAHSNTFSQHFPNTIYNISKFCINSDTLSDEALTLSDEAMKCYPWK